MRTGIFIALIPFHRRRLEATVRDRADGIGTVKIMRRTGKSKTCVWRWQERFMRERSTDCCVTRPARREPLRFGRTKSTA